MTMKDVTTLDDTEYTSDRMNGGDTISPQAADVVDSAIALKKQHIDEKVSDEQYPANAPLLSEKKLQIDEDINTSSKHHSEEDSHLYNEEAFRNKYQGSNSSDIESDQDRDELIPDSPRVNYTPDSSHGFDLSQRLPSNLNPYNSSFVAEEARLRYSLESAQLKERFRQSLNDEVLRRGFPYSPPGSHPRPGPDSNKLISPGSRGLGQDLSPESKSLNNSPINALRGAGRPQSFSYEDEDSVLTPNIREGLYFCHLCSFSGTTQSDFDLHMTIHFEHVCPHCDYKSRTEGRLKRHIKDFHTEDNEQSRTMPGRPKVFRCKQCEFHSTDKVEFWAHSRTHIKEDKLLQCPRCPFVTEYKHHLEYHLRNHFGSKPFKCPKCNYACVNKSMLNSHMKSHTNVYQYRCADCTYATKYCHSLKLHLRKYNHKPAAVLNSDGSLPQGMDATASGLSLLSKRGPPRGPRGPRKDKLEQMGGNYLQMPPSPMPGMPGGLPGMPPGMMSPFWPIMQGQLPNGMPNPLGLGARFNSPFLGMPPMGNSIKTEEMKSPPMPSPNAPNSNNPFKCNFCSFAATNREVLTSHVMKAHASDNQDLFSIFGISSESLLEDNHKRMNVMKSLRSPHKLQHMPRMPGMFSPTDMPRDMPRQIKQEPQEADDKYTNSQGHSNVKVNQDRNGHGKEQLSPFPYMNGKFQADANTKDEGMDILKQMTLKFGSGPADLKRKFDAIAEKEKPVAAAVDSPLDLTKPRSSPPMMYPIQPFSALDDNKDEGHLSSGENSVYSTDVTSPTPRKRSRKGKAFKLDTLCMKLQEKQGMYDSEEDSTCEMDEMYTSDLLPVEADTNSPDGEYDPDSEENEIEVEKIQPEISEKESVADDKTENKIASTYERGYEEDKEKLQEDELRSLHSSLMMLNEKKTFDKEINGNVIAADVNVQNKEISESKVDNVSIPSPGSDEGSKFTMAPSHNRRKSVPAAIQRGADIAWKMLNDPKFSDPSQLIGNTNNGHKMELSAMDRKLWIEAPDCTAAAKKSDYECPHCQIMFGDCIMYTMHMGYHGYKDPYKCNMCGDTCKDRVEFFLHIARAAHN